MAIKTKIVATIGPASLDFAVFQKLVDAGIDYIRINTAYGDEAQYDQILDNLKQASGAEKIEAMLDVKDLKTLEYAKSRGIKNIALSFVEDVARIEAARAGLPGAFIISKIESGKGADNFDAILEASDGIMVARGDLGESVGLEKVPMLQKEFTRKTIEKEKFLITATEMLLSMTENPEPTRAEVSDVANAVFDHTSAVMLSEETAIGKYPVETVQMMAKIIQEAEEGRYEQGA